MNNENKPTNKRQTIMYIFEVCIALLKYKFRIVDYFFNVERMRNERTYLHCIVLHFTNRTDGTLFFTFLFVVDKRKTYFVSVPIKFVGG